jgi:hypothetical protein
MTRKIALVVALVVALALPATAQAETVTYVHTWDPGTRTFACGETIDYLAGGYRVALGDGWAGYLGGLVHVNAFATYGIGETTGKLYRVVGALTTVDTPTGVKGADNYVFRC